MNELQIFNNPEFGEVRVIDIDGEPWMVGKDVAAALGYSNPRDALAKHVDEEDKSSVAFRDGTSGNPNLTVINESGLYSLVLSSKTPKARKFRRWVTAEVLPAIRKHGAYMTADTIERVLSDPDTIIQLATSLKEERQRRAVLEAQVEADKPKVLFADSVAASKSSILIGELAKLLKQNGIPTGQNRLFTWLRCNGYLIRRQGTDYNMPTQRSMELGLFEIKETVINHSDGHTSVNRTPKVTGKGQLYFVDLFLKQEGITHEEN